MPALWQMAELASDSKVLCLITTLEGDLGVEPSQLDVCVNSWMPPEFLWLSMMASPGSL